MVARQENGPAESKSLAAHTQVQLMKVEGELCLGPFTYLLHKTTPML
jgi:hypothetical protein